MKKLALVLLLGALVAVACDGENAENNDRVPSPTAEAPTYTMTTAAGVSWLRRVVSAYEMGAESTAEDQCTEGGVQLAVADLRNVGSGDRGAGLDQKTLEQICQRARDEGWPAVRTQAREAID